MGKFADELAPKFADDDAPRLADFSTNSVAWIVQRYIEEMRLPGARGISRGQEYAMRIWQRSPIAGRDATKLELKDYAEHARARKMNLVPTKPQQKNRPAEINPATIGKDFSDLSVVFTHAFDYWNVKVDLELLKKAKRVLKKEGLVSKSTPRDRRPTQEEHERRIAYFQAQNSHQNTKVDMVLMERWQMASGRRVGESCALLWADWNRAERTILVRKMKDPRRKNKAKVVALTPDAQEMLEELWNDPNRDPRVARIFPWDKRTVSARSTQANKALGIPNLRLHDSRRDCISRIIERGFTSNEAAAVSGHENPAILERTYAKPSVGKIAAKMASR